MFDERTLVIVNRLSFGVVETGDDQTPILGVMRIQTPSGDRVNLALTPQQVDDASTGFANLAVELMLR